MKNKFIKLVFVAFALITQLSPLKAQTQEIDLSGKWGISDGCDGFPAWFVRCALYTSFARIDCPAYHYG